MFGFFFFLSIRRDFEVTRYYIQTEWNETDK